MAEYTPPGNDNVDFEIDTSSAYTPPDNDAVDFTLKAFKTPVLTATAVSGDQIDLTWTASGGGQDGYRIYRAEASGSTTADYTQIADVGSDTTAYSDTGREDGERYFYRVEAYQSDGDTALSAEAAATTALPAASVTPDTSTEDEITLSWTKADDSPDGTWELYRSEDGSLGTLIETFTDLSTASYTDTGLDDGEEYIYTLRRVTDHAEADATQSAIALLPAPTDLSLSPGTREIALSWGVTHDDGTQTVQFKRSSESTWTDWATGLSLSTTSATITGLLDGEEYDVRVLAVNDTTAAAIDTATTELPDAQQPSLNNGIEDELTASWTDVINYGDYRAQIRETGQSAWDGTATGYAEQVVDEATTSVTFGGLEDGEAYEVRLRTETEHTTGAWTDLVDAVTAFPTPSNVTVSSTAATSATIVWDDQADNEDGFRIPVAEERFGSFGSDQVYQTLAPNTEQATLNLKPDTTYRVTVEAFTEDASVAESVTLTTDPPAVATGGATQVPASGPHLEIDHPSNGRTLTPQIVGEVAPPRALNELPTTRVQVAGDRWTADTWVGADCRLWIDGTRQPVESVVRPVQTPEGAELELRGGEALLKRVEQSVIEQEADDFVRDLLDEEAPDIAQTVDDPASTINSDTRVLSADTTDEWTDRIPAAPYPDDDPRVITSGGKVRTQRIAAFQETEDGPNAGESTLLNDSLSSGAGKNVGPNSIVRHNLDVAYTIPAEHAKLGVRLAYEDDTHPAFQIELDGVQVGSVAAADSDPTSPNRTVFEFTWTDLGADIEADFGDVAAGEHELDVVTGAAASDGSPLTVDCGAIIDTRYTSLTDETLTDGGPVSYPRLHPGTSDIITDDVETIRQVVGGRAEVSVTNTLRNQAVAISNDQGANWIEATNADTVEGSFASGTTNIRARVTLSNYASGTDGQPVYDAGQAVDLVTLFADLDDAPILVDQVYDGTIESVITEVAEFADAFWEVQWNPEAGSQSVEWTFPGQRQAAGDASVVDYETSVDATQITEKAVVYGTSQSVSDEEVSLQHDTAVALEERYNQPAQITIKSTPDGSTTYERGSDFTYDPQAGEVTALSTGSISDGETVSVDYETRVRGLYTLPGWSGDETVARTRTIPAATTDRSAETAARILVQRTSEPITSVSVTIEELPVRWGLVEMVSLAEVPAADGLEIYSIDPGQGTVSLQLGTRGTVDAVVSDIQTRLEATASKV